MADTKNSDSQINAISNECESKYLLRNYFTSCEWFSYALVIIAGLAMRWFELDARPYHHDESQHAMFGKYFFDWPEIQFYKYDPMMHAPLLYNLYRVVYTALGHTLWSARAPIALLGSLFLFVPLIFRKYFSPTALLALTAGIALSPSMVYWSRFLIHDYFVVLAMLIALYGAVQADSSRRSFYVLLGFSLQFCIKANVYVTIALVLGYLIFESLFRFFLDQNLETKIESFFSYLVKYLLLFIAVSAILICLFDYSLSSLINSHERWKEMLGDFSQHRFTFNLVFFIILCLTYNLSYFLFFCPESLLGRIWKNICQHKLNFLLSFAISSLVYCYIFTSGFRNQKGILDGLYRESLPYWINQHAIERIQGPFLFHFYVFSWYESAFMVFFAVQLFLFYRNANIVTKIAGMSVTFLAIIFSLLTLYYISPEKGSEIWRSIPNLKTEATGIWRLLFAIWGEFKLKDCLDVFGLFFLLFHPIILTSTHLYKKEYILAFWGYLFTAMFFTYSFAGEKVPWLAIYPLVAGFVYLTLYFDDWFKNNPIVSFEKFQLRNVFRWFGISLLSLGVIFVLENFISLTSIFEGHPMKNLLDLAPSGNFKGVFTAVVNCVSDNIVLFLLGIMCYGLYFINRWTQLLGYINLKTFLFVFVSIFCIRASILTNFVYAGSETEYMSQVHTTKEFHEVALKLRKEALTNLGEEPFTILGDGDPVWPLTWYMIGVNDFKFTATTEERKTFNYILQTYEENPTNIPPGFEKRRVNLRGWWVPDFNQMTIKKFLVYALNHFPWSPSGFTYVWVLKNTEKK